MSISRKKLWEEVCEVVVLNWNELGAEDKTKQGSRSFLFHIYQLPSTGITKRKNKINAAPVPIDLDKAIIEALNKDNTIDEDKNFALSLVPLLKNLTADEKLDAKIAYS